VALTITCGDPPEGNVGIAYSHTFPATSGTAPYTFAISAGSLPTGLTLDEDTGIVSGTPTTKQTAEFTIEVTDAVDASTSADCSIRIVGACLVEL
jgi:hypothetical protein